MHGETAWNGSRSSRAWGWRTSRAGLAGGPGFPHQEARAVPPTCGGIRVVSVYVPNGRQPGSEHYATSSPGSPRCARWSAAGPEATIVCGDMNIAPTDDDVFDPEAYVGQTHVTPPERAALAELQAVGLHDVVRDRWPDERVFTYWDYRAGMFHQDLGMRIDLVLASSPVADRVRAAWVDRQARKGKGPSDHAPVIVDLDEAPDGDIGRSCRRPPHRRPSAARSSCRRRRRVALVAGDDAQVLELAGREVRITSPGKVLFAERGETKLDLVRYYAAVAEPLMRTMGGRPVLMQRFPQGAGGPSFFQKRVPDSAPDWLETTTVQTVNGTPSRALVAADVAHVAWAVNLACLGFHVWPHRADDPDHADELRLDLDPQPGTELRRGPRGRHGAQGAAGRARHRRLSQDDRQPRTARLRPPAAALGLLRRALRRGGRRARARAPAPRHPHRRLVEGGARRADLRRLQPERAAQDGLRRVVGARPRGRAGLHASSLGRARRRASRRADARQRPGRLERDGDPWAAIDDAPQSLEPLLALHERDRENGLLDAPWPPVYPKQPDEPPRVAPSRARREE